ncbi:MAG: hypothetical protein HUK15_08290 [Bacteroidales bacterium]|nr:hypothetical protein [Bacteroidales bacterium]
MAKKVFIIDDVHPLIIKGLQEANYEITDATKWNRAEIAENIKDVYGLVLRSRINIDKDLIDQAQSLRFVARVGAGMETIDTQYCESRGIKCLNSPEGNRNAVGEHTLGMLLSLLNNLNRADREVKAGEWKRESNRGRELGSCTVGIIGYGNMGSSFAQKLAGFDCKVLAYDKYKSNYGDKYAQESSLEQLFENADIISLHVPLTDETKYMVDENFIKKFKKPIILLNAARGPVVKTADLAKALKNGKITAAGLDTIEYEETSFEKTKSMSVNYYQMAVSTLLVSQIIQKAALLIKLSNLS